MLFLFFVTGTLEGELIILPVAGIYLHIADGLCPVFPQDAEIEFSLAPCTENNSDLIVLLTVTAANKTFSQTDKIIGFTAGMKQIFHIAAIGFCV